MTLKDKIYYNFLTLKEFNDLAQSNIEKSNELSIDTFHEFKDNKLVGRLILLDKLLYEKEFSGEHLQIMLAKMYYNWSLILDKHLKVKQDEEYRLKMENQEALGGQNYDTIDEQEDDRLTMGERAKKFGNR